MEAALRAKKILRALDPNDDPSAEPLSPVALFCVLLATAVSTYWFLRWKIQPMQDTGLHLAFTAVVADYGKPGSIYPAIYKSLDFLNTNSLLYTVAGLLGKVIGPSWAYRLTLLTYVTGVPLVNLYALRVFGRSAWGAVLSVPLTYNLSFAYGFANFLFAAPLSVLALPLFYRMLVAPSWKRVLACTVLMTALFLAHLHIFLWTGFLLAIMTVVGLFVATKRSLFGFPSTKPGAIVLSAVLSVIPALALLGRWMYRTSKPSPPDELVLVTVAKASTGTFRDGIMAPAEAFNSAARFLVATKSADELWFFVAYIGLALFAFAVGRKHTWKRPPVLELACGITILSYFLLPETFAGQQVIASRQLGYAAWFASAVFTPVPGRVTQLGRLLVIGAIIFVTTSYLRFYSKLLEKFEREEAAGLEEVIAAAPPRKRLHYVNFAPESKYFNVRSFWHVEKWYMADRLGQCNENPAWGGSQAIRYRSSYALHRIESHSHQWPSNPEIWENFDLVLIRQWRPQPADLARANQNGELVAKRGDWEIWRSKIAK